METKEELQKRPPVTADDMEYREGPLGVYILIDGLIGTLARAEIEKRQGFFEKLGRDLGLITSQPAWQGWNSWGAGNQLRYAALLKAGWAYEESLLPYHQSANAYERVRRALISPDCQSASDLMNLI